MATYAIVKTGGKQYKVAVGDLVKVEKIEGEPGTAVSLAPVLVVDGSDLTTDAAKLAKVAVTSEIVEHTKGPKIRIHKFQEQDRLPQASGPQAADHGAQGHGHQVTSFFLANFHPRRGQ